MIFNIKLRFCTFENFKSGPAIYINIQLYRTEIIFFTLVICECKKDMDTFTCTWMEIVIIYIFYYPKKKRKKNEKEKKYKLT